MIKQIYNLIPSEDELIKIFALRNKLCTLQSTDDNLIKTAKIISKQIIDFVLYTPIIELTADKNSIDGMMYVPNIEDVKFDKKFSYDLNSNHIVDNIVISDLKDNVNLILGTMFNCKVLNTQFKFDNEHPRVHIRINFL